MKIVAIVLLFAGVAIAGPAQKGPTCDPFTSPHGCKAGQVVKVHSVNDPELPRTPCDPFSSPHGCDSGLVAQADPAPAAPTPGTPSQAPAAGEPLTPPAPPAKSDTAALRKTCVDAMNADPAFAQSVVATADKQIDQKTIDAHKDAYAHIQKNENHVIYAYAAMWVIAALLVGFLFLRQQGLKAEIAALRRDLKAAEDKA